MNLDCFLTALIRLAQNGTLANNLNQTGLSNCDDDRKVRKTPIRGEAKRLRGIQHSPALYTKD